MKSILLQYATIENWYGATCNMGIYLSAKSQAKIPKQMRTFEDSQKSKKTVASMIERKGDEKSKKSGERA